MPNIEVIPSAKEAKTPGWAYVADAGIDPSKQAIVPSGARKRARISYVDERAAPALQVGEVSTREQGKINKRLAELDKENHRDVKIEVPGKPKDVAQLSIRPGGKMTLGVKKILSSQKTWSNYLDDEEARLTQLQHSSAAQRHAQQLAAKAADDKARRSSTSAPTLKGKRASNAATLSKERSEADEMDVDAAPEPGSNRPELMNATQESLAAPKEDLSADILRLITVETPKMPSPEEIEALLSAPALSYNQARAVPSTSTAPPRQFCEICGFWGRARCMKCGVRVCALDCLRTHEDTRCQKFYA